MTPQQEIEKLHELNGNMGYYGTHHQFIILIENRLHKKAKKIMDSINQGGLWINEREVHNRIYNYLLTGMSVNEIKNKFRG